MVLLGFMRVRIFSNRSGSPKFLNPKQYGAFGLRSGFGISRLTSGLLCSGVEGCRLWQGWVFSELLLSGLADQQSS